MFLQLVFISFVFLFTSIDDVNGQNRTTIISCQSQSRCPSTHFCNLRQRVCVTKFSAGSICSNDVECLSDKCFEKICRRSCSNDNECSLTKEYCTTFTKYCQEKHCGLCTRNVQCANNRCGFLHCVSTNCSSALIELQKKT